MKNNSIEQSFSIFKYKLEVEDRQVIQMPVGAEILSAQLQGDEVCIWAKVTLDNVITEGRIIRVIGTGHHFNDSHLKFIDTVQMMQGKLVWHIFEALP